MPFLTMVKICDEWVSEWISCLTSQLTIFQSYMWRHIDVQADWRRSCTYGRAPNAIDISQGSLTCPSKHRHGTNLFIRWFRHTAPISRLLRSRWGYGGHILDLTPGPSRGKICDEDQNRTNIDKNIGTHLQIRTIKVRMQDKMTLVETTRQVMTILQDIGISRKTKLMARVEGLRHQDTGPVEKVKSPRDGQHLWQSLWRLIQITVARK